MSDEPIITIDEYLSSAEDSEAIILGGVDGESTCTFPRGYLKRQAVYCCKTCFDITGKRAGICFECSVQCHDEHDIIELYTKRHFRCDCGNSNFDGAASCNLWEEKDDINSENCYDQTYDGVFCCCSRPYPDPESEDEVEMFQCGICEDWFHLNHLGLPSNFKPDEDFEEMTCSSCVMRLPFLWLYYHCYQLVFQSLCEPSMNESASKINVDETLPKRRRIHNDETECRLSLALDKCGCSTMDLTEDELSKLRVEERKFPSPIFWPSDWRTNILCHCQPCKDRYQSLGIEFITDPEDTISRYMEVGKKRATEMGSQYFSEISSALSELPHAAAVNVAQGITKLKVAMEEFLSIKRESGHVITAEEVKLFCEKLKKDLL